MIKNEKMKAFEKHREHLIDQLLAKECDKTEFVFRNYNFFNQEGQEPYEVVNTIEEGLYNYQYYNTMAKYARIMAKELKYKDPFVAVDFKKSAVKLYYKKEHVTTRLIELYDKGDMEAYFIKVSSKSLNGKLFEIVFKDLDRVILHSMNLNILKLLNKRKCFENKTKKSIIDDYINSLY